MDEDEVRGNLEDVESLNEKNKQKLTDMGYIAASDVAKKKGRARKIRVKIADKNGLKLELVATRENANKKPYPKAEDRLKSIGLCQNINEDLLAKIKDGKINDNHVKDLLKLGNAQELIQLDSHSQEKIIDNIIRNRNEHGLRNAEEVAWYAINNGNKDRFNLETWYRGILYLTQKLTHQANVHEDIVDGLFIEQKETLRQKLNDLNKVLSILMLILDK